MTTAASRRRGHRRADPWQVAFHAERRLRRPQRQELHRTHASSKKNFGGPVQTPRPRRLRSGKPIQGAHIMSEGAFPLSRRGFVVAGVSATGVALPSNLAHSQVRSTTMQAIIRAGGQVVTLVNVFTVEAAKLSSLLDVLRDGTETFFSQMPGFVSSSVLTAKNGG